MCDTSDERLYVCVGMFVFFLAPNVCVTHSVNYTNYDKNCTTNMNNLMKDIKSTLNYFRNLHKFAMQKPMMTMTSYAKHS